MASIKLKINNKDYTVDVDPKMPLLWAIRDVVGLTGTKYGCGIAQCGARIEEMVDITHERGLRDDKSVFWRGIIFIGCKHCDVFRSYYCEIVNGI